MSADLSWLLCSRSRTGRRLGLWDITKAETTLRNVPNAGRNMSASRARSSLRAMLRLARERRLANNAIATRASYYGWHFAGVAKTVALPVIPNTYLRVHKAERSARTDHCISLAPARLDRYPCGSTGHVADPVSSIRR